MGLAQGPDRLLLKQMSVDKSLTTFSFHFFLNLKIF